MNDKINEWVRIGNDVLEAMGINPKCMGSEEIYRLWNHLDYFLEDSPVKFREFEEAFIFFHEA
jgi:hypothetical protein